MKEFIRIQENRIRKTNIKKYSPLGDKRINVYFSTSRYKIELETFNFESTESRDEVLIELDNMFVL